MKIGTITFHWANNYGAVLQAYALQQFLLKNGYETQVLDYKPGKLYFREVVRDAVQDRSKLEKRKKIRSFVKSNIRLSPKTAYRSAVIAKGSRYDAVICGSDQIWNEWQLFHAEKKPCLAYYLGTLPDSVKKISYAASFGTNALKEKTKALIQPVLAGFRGVSVRENTAVQMLQEIGVPAVRTCDPTLLLNAEDYRTLLCDDAKPQKVFSFILHKNQTWANEIAKTVKQHFNDGADAEQILSVPEWLAAIDSCQMVVTNSFHATVFSILFHKNFVVLPVAGKDMNDRIVTLLETVGLSKHFCADDDAVEACIHDQIDWQSVDAHIDQIRQESAKWLINCIET